MTTTTPATASPAAASPAAASPATPSPAATTAPVKEEVAIFAMGCFWGPELKYSKIPGIIDADVGYIGGKLDNPTYKQVCTGATEHAEAVRIRFNPAIISYQQLVDLFFTWHDPTQVNRQGPDIGTQYRTAIFYTSPEQQKLAEATKAKLEGEKKFRRPIATQIVAASTFWKAEEYHQDYLKKQGMDYCPSEGPGH